MNNRKFIILLLLVCLLLPAGSTMAQMTEKEIRQRLDLVYGGYADKVREELPVLLKQHRDDPGVLFLDAVLTPDGLQASKKYQTIVDMYPQSEWADDALYRIHQYYYSIGLYKTADQKMEQLKQEYPQSIFVTGQEAGTPVKTAPATVPAADTIKEEATPVAAAPEPPSSEQKMIFAPGRKFAVQAGAFATKENADKQAAFFKSIGKDAVVTVKETTGKTLYVVSIEGGLNELQARDIIAELKTKYNIESIIVAR